LSEALRLLFARHAESEANQLRVISNRDLPHALTPLGRQQAVTLADSLVDKGISVIYASPILRAAETAQLVGVRLGLAVQTADALREPDCGVLEGHSDEAAWAIHARVRQDWFEYQCLDSRMDGGESYLDVRDRFTAFKQFLEEQAGCILLVSHGMLLRIILTELVVNLPAAFITHHIPDYSQTVLIEPRDDGWYAVEWCGEKVEISGLRTGGSVS